MFDGFLYGNKTLAVDISIHFSYFEDTKYSHNCMHGSPVTMPLEVYRLKKIGE